MKDKIKKMLYLRNDQADTAEIEERLREGATVTGSNLYILIFAILIASIGLNMNSTAVVIGAMLISPLMGVIMYFAYNISAQNYKNAEKCIVKIGLQVLVSIITSTIYFVISPLTYFSGELMARTTPTLWDVLIAFFGGFSAIIAMTRKSKVSNVIPGAAIATALMPPLCTVGYCISQGQVIRALGAVYLFTINAVFICVSGIIGLYIMNAVDIKAHFKNKKKRRFLILTIIIVIIPSAIMAWDSVKKEQISNNYNEFLNKEFIMENANVVKSDISTLEKNINVFLMGKNLTETEIQELKDKLPEYNLENYTLNIIQSDQYMDEILDNKKNENTDKALLEAMRKKDEFEENTGSELMVLYPDVLMAGFTEIADKDGNSHFTAILKVKEYIKNDEKMKMKKWLEMKFDKKIEIIQKKEDTKKKGN